MADVLIKADELLKVDLGHMSHLFFEEIKHFFGMREVRLEDLGEEAIDDFPGAVNQLSNLLYRIESHRQKRENFGRSLTLLRF